jgi:hypothetical protein
VYAEAMITHSQPGTRLIAFILLLLLAGSSVLSGSMMPLHLANLGLLLLVATSLSRLIDVCRVSESLDRLIGDQKLLAQVQRIVDACSLASMIHDPIHRELLLERIGDLATGMEVMATGSVEFDTTERWRLFYEQLLTSPGLHKYQSVAWVRDDSYWHSEAGLNSIRLNHRLSELQQLTIERIVILSDELWPDRKALPVVRIQDWLIEQHHHDISLWLVRESELAHEADLLMDLGIYGIRATGIQELDDEGGTRRFTLQFGFEHVQAAQERWKRLLVYAVKYRDFLDRYSVTE